MHAPGHHGRRKMMRAGYDIGDDFCFGRIRHARFQDAHNRGRARPQVNVAQRLPEVLEWFALRWGSKPHPLTENYFQWQVVNGMAVALCRDVEPFLVQKRAQALNIIAFSEAIIPGKGFGSLMTEDMDFHQTEAQRLNASPNRRS